MNDVRYSEARNLEVPCEYKKADGTIAEYMRGLHSSDILKFFKLGGKNGNGPIHPDAQGGAWIGDTCLFIVPARKSPHWDKSLPGARVGRRVVAMCNRCGRMVCPGHLHQHRRGRKCIEAGEAE